MKFLSENCILLPSHLFATELPGSNFFPPTFSLGKCNLQVANLLHVLATVNFGSCSSVFYVEKIPQKVVSRLFVQYQKTVMKS